MHPVYDTCPAPTPNTLAVNNLTGPQVAQRATWSRVPDLAGSPLLGLHSITTGVIGRTTATVVNPLDPGTVDDGRAVDGSGAGWLEHPGSWNVPLVRAGRR
jgi:hypothetical protein